MSAMIPIRIDHSGLWFVGVDILHDHSDVHPGHLCTPFVLNGSSIDIERLVPFFLFRGHVPHGRKARLNNERRAYVR